MLVGGGELHDRFSTRSSAPRCRCAAGSSASPGSRSRWSTTRRRSRTVLPELAERLRGRVMVAHNAPFDRRVLRQAFEREGSSGPTRRCSAPPRWRARCSRCSASAGWARSPTRSGSRSRSRIARSPTPRRARGCCARCSRGCAPTRPRSPSRSRCSRPGRRRQDPEAGRSSPPATAGRPHGRLLRAAARPRRLPVPRRRTGRRCTSASRSRSAAAPGPTSRPRRRPADWTAHAAIVDYRATRSELGALVLENRLIKELRPPGNTPADPPRRPARLHPLPARHPVPDPRGLARPGRRPRGHDRAAARPAARARARRAARLAVRPAPLRPAPAAPRASLGLRADGSLPVAVPRRSRPEPLPPPARRGAAAVRAAAATRPSRLIAHVERPDARGRRAAALRAGASLRRRARRLAVILERLGGVLEATHARPRLMLAAHPTEHALRRVLDRRRAASSTGARCAGDLDELERAHAGRARPRRAGRRARRARPARRGRRGADRRHLPGVPPGHAAARRSTPPPEPRAAARLRAQPRTAARRPRPGPPRPDRAPTDPGGASRRTSASAIGPSRGEVGDARDLADARPAERDRLARLGRAPSRSPRRCRFGLPR